MAFGHECQASSSCLCQLLSQTVLFSSYGLVGAYFGAQMERDLPKSIEEFIKYKNKKNSHPFRGRERAVFVLNPGDCVLVTPNIIHKQSAAFVFEINGGLELLEEHGYVFKRAKEI